MQPADTPRGGRSAATAASVVVAVAYAWWASRVPGFSWSAAVAVGVPGIAVTVAFARPRRRRAREPRALGRAGATAWATTIGALVVWELIQYRGSPRSAHPTVSAAVDRLLEPHPIRAAAFVVWLGFGWLLAR